VVLIYLSAQIINWISENVMSFDAFDQIQEFILGECVCVHVDLHAKVVLEITV